MMVALAAIVGWFAGTVASVAGFGIGSLLTPLFAIELGTSAAVAAVAIPHAAATILRAWRLRRDIDWAFVARFGSWSAAGGLVGALFFARLGGPALTRILGALLVLTAISGVSGWADRVRVPRGAAWLLGIASGFFGGIVGNQGGLRAGALLGLGVGPTAFVAVSTVTGVVIDAVRTPIYLVRAGDAVLAAWPMVVAATAGALIGTLSGERVLRGLSERAFKKTVAALIGALGLWLLLWPQPG